MNKRRPRGTAFLTGATPGSGAAMGCGNALLGAERRPGRLPRCAGAGAVPSGPGSGPRGARRPSPRGARGSGRGRGPGRAHVTAPPAVGQAAAPGVLLSRRCPPPRLLRPAPQSRIPSRRRSHRRGHDGFWSYSE